MLDECECLADVDEDGSVEVDDLTAVALDWGSDGSAHGGDVTANGMVDVDDLVAVLLGWGPCPGRSFRTPRPDPVP
ncbi:MAG: hypothetical protein ACYTJ0_01320 [Planctomycetota bacterium]|jgi:hypothetical protein